jgi:ABC-type glycerol-3-phosphate transport system substrate-binding protein
VNIYNYYRKFLEKSRAFLSAIHIPVKFNIPGKWINIGLAAVFVLVIIIIAIARNTGGPGKTRHIDIAISPGFENLFGKELAGALIKDFEKQRPGLRIKKDVENTDILFFDDSEFYRLRSGSQLLSLNPYIDTKTKDEETDLEEDVSNTQWALPLTSFMDLLFYNIDILQAANIDRPPKTRAEFLTVARAVANTGEGQDKVYSFALDLAGPQTARSGLYPWIWAAGGEICANGAPALSRIAVDTIAFFAHLQNEELLPPEQETGAQLIKEFAEGKIAMITSSSSDIAYLQRHAGKLNFGVTAIPGTAQGKIRLGLFRIYAGLSAECAIPDQAWNFISFIAGKSEILAEALNAVPGSLPAAFPGEYIVENPLFSKAWDIFEAAEIVEYRSDDPPEEVIESLVREKLKEQGLGG